MEKKPNLLLKAFLASCVIEAAIILVALISRSGMYPMFHLVAWEVVGLCGINVDLMGLIAAYIVLAGVQILLLVPVSYFVLRWTGNGLG